MECSLPPIAASFGHPLSGSRCIGREGASHLHPPCYAFMAYRISFKDLFFVYGRFEHQPKYDKYSKAPETVVFRYMARPRQASTLLEGVFNSGLGA